MSKIEQVAKLLEKGKTLSTQDIQKIGIARPRNAIHSLRKQGYCIYGEKNKTGTHSYRLGAPSKAMVASLFATFGVSMYDEDF